MRDIPSFMVIKPVICKTYACYEPGTESGHVHCKGKSVFDPFTNIEFEPAKKLKNYYHLRFCQSNRYWAKSGDTKWIAAVSKQPEEDVSLSSCTLFSPTIDDNGVLCLAHISGARVQTDSSSSCVYLDEDDDEDDDGEKNSDSYVDWDVLVKIPSRVVFKGDNGKILKAVIYDGYNHLQFASTDGNDGYSAQNVVLQPDGHFG